MKQAAVVQAALDATGLSQVALAELLGTDPSTVRRWLSDPETDSHRPMPGPARWACRALAVSPELATLVPPDR